MVQHAAEAELLLQPQHGQDVVLAMGVMVHDALAVEHLDQRLETEVAFGQLGRVAGGFGDLAPVVARTMELGAHQRRRLATRAGERWVALRIGAVRHLDAAGGTAVGVAHQQVVDGAPVAQLQIDGLARQQMTAARHHVDGGDATGLRLLDAGIERIDRIECPHLGLDRSAAVGAGHRADVRVTAHQPRHDGATGGIDAHRVVGHHDVGHRSDRDDAAAAHQQRAAFDRRRVDRFDPRTDERVWQLLGRERQGEQTGPEGDRRQGGG